VRPSGFMIMGRVPLDGEQGLGALGRKTK
jgi:hypothetical protein